ncbi:hypothetical protein [Salinifilum ghardaiensis]
MTEPLAGFTVAVAAARGGSRISPRRGRRSGAEVVRGPALRILPLKPETDGARGDDA